MAAVTLVISGELKEVVSITSRLSSHFHEDGQQTPV